MKTTEIVDHLFFKCPVAKVVWGVVAKCIHKKNRSSSYILLGSGMLCLVGIKYFCFA
jgi:hypothetical protein